MSDGPYPSAPSSPLLPVVVVPFPPAPPGPPVLGCNPVLGGSTVLSWGSNKLACAYVADTSGLCGARLARANARGAEAGAGWSAGSDAPDACVRTRTVHHQLQGSGGLRPEVIE